MDFQKMKQVDESSSKKVNQVKGPNKFDLNLMPETSESEEFYIEIFEGVETPHVSLNLTNKNQEVNTNSNGLILPFSASGHINAAASNFNDNTSSSATEIMVQTPSHPFDDKRRVHCNDGSSAGSMTRTLRPRRPEPNFGPNFERRVCTNYNCRTRNTPMWRRGPLGPKTLCNACGIQYKKQVTSRGSNQ